MRLKRLISALIACAMLFTMVPNVAFARDKDPTALMFEDIKNLLQVEVECETDDVEHFPNTGDDDKKVYTAANKDSLFNADNFKIAEEPNDDGEWEVTLTGIGNIEEGIPGDGTGIAAFVNQFDEDCKTDENTYTHKVKADDDNEDDGEWEVDDTVYVKWDNDKKEWKVDGDDDFEIDVECDNRCEITIDVENGSATYGDENTSVTDGKISVEKNGSVNLSFIADPNHVLDTVEVNNEFITATANDDGSYSYTFEDVTNDQSISVLFSKDTYGVDDPDRGDGIPDKYQAVVTYKVENGYWNNGDKDNEDKTEVVTLRDAEGNLDENGTGTLAKVPAVGNNPKDNGYEGGSWSPSEPTNETTVNAGDTTYTYTYKEKDPTPPTEYTVTYMIQNGTWESGLTTIEAKVQAVEGATLGDTIPNTDAVQPNLGYLNTGKWNTAFDANTTVNESVTYTYTLDEDPVWHTEYDSIRIYMDQGTKSDFNDLGWLINRAIKITSENYPILGERSFAYALGLGYWYTTNPVADVKAIDITSIVLSSSKLFGDDYRSITIPANGNDKYNVAFSEGIGDFGFKHLRIDITKKTTTDPDGNCTVTYTDGEGGTVFANQVTSGLEVGDVTPEFHGSTDREGYIFMGWDPQPSETVQGTVTYTAQWEKDSNKDNIPDKYQAVVTYKVEGGYWSGVDANPKTEVVTLVDSDGKWSENGTGTLQTIPVNMMADSEHNPASGNWYDDSNAVVESMQAVRITKDGATYTYKFTPVSSGPVNKGGSNEYVIVGEPDPTNPAATTQGTARVEVYRDGVHVEIADFTIQFAGESASLEFSATATVTGERMGTDYILSSVAVMRTADTQPMDSITSVNANGSGQIAEIHNNGTLYLFYSSTFTVDGIVEIDGKTQAFQTIRDQNASENQQFINWLNNRYVMSYGNVDSGSAVNAILYGAGPVDSKLLVKNTVPTFATSVPLKQGESLKTVTISGKTYSLSTKAVFVKNGESYEKIAFGNGTDPVELPMLAYLKEEAQAQNVIQTAINNSYTFNVKVEAAEAVNTFNLYGWLLDNGSGLNREQLDKLQTDPQYVSPSDTQLGLIKNGESYSVKFIAPEGYVLTGCSEDKTSINNLIDANGEGKKEYTFRTTGDTASNNNQVIARAFLSKDENGDLIPDMNQVKFTYTVDNSSMGSLSGETTRTEYVLKGADNAAQPQAVPTPVSMNGYTFDYWQAENGDKDYHPTMSTLKKQGYTADTTFIAHFAKDENGDKTPDERQIFVNYSSNDDRYGTVSADPAYKVFTFEPDEITNVEADGKLPVCTLSAEATETSDGDFDRWTSTDDLSEYFPQRDATLNVDVTFTVDQLGDTFDVVAHFNRETGGGGAHHPDAGDDDDDDNDRDDDDTEEIIDEEVPLADTPWLNTEDHYAYIVGYSEDGTVRPNANISRAEVATIFFRLLTDNARDQFWMTSNNFSDVLPNDWYNTAVSTMVNMGIIQGYEDGTFRPNANITRAEFATIAARFMASGYEIGDDLFVDIASHWARESINDAAMAGWINGYEDGTFRPDAAITRAEAVTLVNNVLQRKPDADHMLDSMIKWPDNPEGAWYYEAIQEATNSHDYDLFEDAEYEIWTALQPNRDWAALEKDWANAHSA